MTDTATPSLMVYGHPSSQPSRSVYWTCLMKGLPFELCVPTDFAHQSTPAFLRLNPKGQIPTIIDDGFALYEMPAILTYLCEKHNWHDLYPQNVQQDVQARALVQQYLHFHHSSTRLATFKLMAPHVIVAFGATLPPGNDILLRESILEARQESDPLSAGQKTIAQVAGMLDSSYFRAGAPFLCGTAVPTIADLACYGELGQLRWAGLFEFTAFPRVAAWLDEMTRLPAHDAVHAYNVALGDIASTPNTMERFSQASTAGIAALQEIGVPVNEFQGNDSC